MRTNDIIKPLVGVKSCLEALYHAVGRLARALPVRPQGGRVHRPHVLDGGRLADGQCASRPELPATARLRIVADGIARQAQYSDGGTWRTTATLRDGYLSDEVVKGGKRFMGATMGMFAVGSQGTVRFSALQVNRSRPNAGRPRFLL